ncbi:phage Gp19/Gp15/Gp42 family protein [uncultured Dubosiella sp.]|uniref:phage Gp19/Gp15/Gp42 family protein n=1 Tax=uncultured Dubosiella sp. TaxID=1937011 RepID=UPI0022C7E726|nr:phage Gp19/Gp15/Gp42 family protein [uncultured Dubosiella sp.]MCZ2855899.1 phage Gp19/Gp15/Gp42 family protein [Candidatus Bathyarchaeota archaeon]
MAYVTITDIEKLFRPLTDAEIGKAEALIDVVSDTLKMEAMKVGKDLDVMLEEGTLLEGVLKSVIVDVIGRALMTSTTKEPVTQYSQSALGYSMSGTFLVPGGGLFIKKTELARLGLRRQKYGMVDYYD